MPPETRGPVLKAYDHLGAKVVECTKDVLTEQRVCQIPLEAPMGRRRADTSGSMDVPLQRHRAESGGSLFRNLLFAATMEEVQGVVCAWRADGVGCEPACSV